MVIYTFAKKQLPKDVLKKVDEDTVAFENMAKENGTQEHYIDLLVDLEEKYKI